MGRQWRMLHYWLSAAILAWHNTLSFLGKSKGGILLDIIIVALTVYRLWRKHGWDEMKKKVFETLLEGLAITCVAAIVVLVVEFLFAPPEMQRVANEQTNAAVSQQHVEHGLAVDCGGQLSTQKERARLLG